MSAGHDHADSFDGMNDDYKRRLIAVTAINIAMFLVEMGAGQLSGSQALKADALDFFADGVTYALSFWAIGKPMRIRTGAAVLKGASLLAMGLWIAGTTLYQFFVHDVPVPEVMGSVGFLALAANLFSVYLLMAYKDGDANIRSVWLCSRNDAIGNVAVMIAAGLVALLNSGAPDLIVAGVMAALFLSSSYQILRQSWREWQGAGGQAGDDQNHEHEEH
ncbi:MAG: cation diffusion facilitator family transporter [Devosia sp.]|nr:cation diffusion facilitator family transporter [Devosia sp.]